MLDVMGVAQLAHTHFSPAHRTDAHHQHFQPAVDIEIILFSAFKIKSFDLNFMVKLGPQNERKWIIGFCPKTTPFDFTAILISLDLIYLDHPSAPPRPREQILRQSIPATS